MTTSAGGFCYKDYHSLYEERRKNWNPIPAERLADDMYKNLLGPKCAVEHFRVVDFGHGADGLFEARLANKVAEREASGDVTVWALDLLKLDTAGELTNTVPAGGIDSDHTNFHCHTDDCDFTDMTTVMALHNERFKSVLFDAGVFCLSISMFSDQLELGLLAAARIIKPSAPIFIVLDVWKLGIRPVFDASHREEITELWGVAFKKATGFTVTSTGIKGSGASKMVYLQLSNVDFDALDTLPEKLKGLTLKSLRDKIPEALRTGPRPSIDPLASPITKRAKMNRK